MLAQIAAVLLGSIGFFAGIDVLFLIGGIAAIILDAFALLRGRLMPLLPLVLYVGGYLAAGSWRGILGGALFGNAMEVFPMLAGAAVGLIVQGIRGDLFARLDPLTEEERGHYTLVWVLGSGITLGTWVLGITLILTLMVTNRC